MLGDGSHVGDALIGARGSATGNVTGLAVHRAGYDTAEVSWHCDASNPLTSEVGVFVDGELVASVPATHLSASLASLADGVHTLGVHTHLAGEPWPDMHGEAYGSRAWVAWAPSTDASARSYRLYRGGVLEATISTVAADTLLYITGGSAGRITVYGEYNGDPVNAVCTAAWQSDGTLDYDVCGATGTITPAKGVTYALPYGQWLQVHDELDAYSTGDAWSWRIGPVRHYLTAELAPGNYSWTVTALDAAGNQSAATVAGACRTLAVPAAVTGVAYTYPVADEISITWALGGTYDSINIYTNKPCSGDWYEDNIVEDAPIGILPGAAVTTGLEDMPDGVFRFCLRPVKDGIERPEVTVYSCTFPATAADLGVVLSTPTALVLTPAAGGGVAVTWQYRYLPGDSVYDFELVANDDNNFDAPPQLAATVLAATGSAWPVAGFTVSAGQDLTDWGAVYVAIRARTAAAAVTSPWVYAGPATPDATAPTLPGAPYALPQ